MSEMTEGRSAESQLKVLSRGAEEVLPTPAVLEAAIEKALAAGQPLRIKWGVDPTAPDLHLGHAVLLRKLREFQDLGHLVVLIIGDFTARIGDPSGRKATRPPLTGAQIDANAKTYTDQAFKVLDRSKTEIRFNSEWLSKLGFEDVVRLASHFTIARLLEREDFAKRMAEKAPISLHELLYPIMQAYDSVELRADVEIGGTEQKFNLLAGRQLQEDFNQPAQICLTMPILEGSDGRRMSKSLGNYVGIAEPPAEIFGKTMRASDELMFSWYRLLTELPEEEIAALEKGVKDGSVHPGETKRRLGRLLVSTYYDEEHGVKAEEQFDALHKKSSGTSAVPDDIPTTSVGADDLKEGRIWLPRLLALCGLAKSNREAREFITAGAVRIDGKMHNDPNEEVAISEGMVLQVGKRHFSKISLD